MTTAPDATWNALFSLFVPLAVLLLCMQISFDERLILLPLIIGLSAMSGLVGLLQVVGSPEGPLYLYRITTTGSAVGLFANRNHAAVLLACTFPLLALFAWSEAAGRRFRSGTAAVIGLALIPLLLVTGSRAGILLGVVGVGSAFALHVMRGNAAGAGNRRRNALFLAAGLVSVVILFVAYSRAEAIQRLLAIRGDEDLRFQALSPILAMLWKYFPFGSGFGSFAPVFQIDEPYGLLMPTFLNHAHDDWLETVTDGGLASLVVLVLAVGCLTREAFRAITAPVRNSSRLMLAQVGAIILVMLGISSLVDYPLRVPSLQCLAVIAIFWLGQRDSDAGPVR
jgi:O-antigen ligase